MSAKLTNLSQINPDIFRVYDIRGVYPSQINENIVERICLGLVKFFLKTNKKNNKKIKIVIGHDARVSSPLLYKTALKVFSQSKEIEIVEAGLITTPMLYFLINYLKADGGLVITASHNPKEYNGIKVAGLKAMPISGQEIKKFI